MNEFALAALAVALLSGWWAPSWWRAAAWLLVVLSVPFAFVSSH